jgi:hypothetical protein
MLSVCVHKVLQEIHMYIAKVREYQFFFIFILHFMNVMLLATASSIKK